MTWKSQNIEVFPEEAVDAANEAENRMHEYFRSLSPRIIEPVVWPPSEDGDIIDATAVEKVHL